MYIQLRVRKLLFLWFSGIWPAAILPDPGLGSSSFSSSRLDICNLLHSLSLIFHIFFSKSRKNAQKTRQNLFSKANKHQFCQFFFFRGLLTTKELIYNNMQICCGWCRRPGLCIFAMPSVKQILANYIIIWWTNWYLCVLFVFFVCFFLWYLFNSTYSNSESYVVFFK